MCDEVTDEREVGHTAAIFMLSPVLVLIILTMFETVALTAGTTISVMLSELVNIKLAPLGVSFY
jgi:hypothetical protein